MKTNVIYLLVTLVLLGEASGAALAASSACAGQSFAEAHSLSELPPAVASSLGRDRHGLDGIADSNEKFNVTDVVNSELPMRRFALAGISASCVLVAVEHGGRGYFVSILAFEKEGSAWHTIELDKLFKPPSTLKKLVAYVAK